MSSASNEKHIEEAFKQPNSFIHGTLPNLSPWVKLTIFLFGISLIRQSILTLWSIIHTIPYTANASEQKMLIDIIRQGPPFLFLLGLLATGLFLLMSYWERKPIYKDEEDKPLSRVKRVVVIFIGLQVISFITSLLAAAIYLVQFGVYDLSGFIAPVAIILGVLCASMALWASWQRKKQLIHQIPADELFV